MLKWNEIADRFFSIYSEKKQSEIVKLFKTTQPSLSHWKTYKEKIPIRVLEQIVDTEDLNWDWLLEGREPKHRESPPERLKG